MLLKFNTGKPNTATVQFRIDPETRKKLTMLRNHYGVTTGVLIKEMIIQSYQSITPKSK
jgi:predicted DNA-binding protein